MGYVTNLQSAGILTQRVVPLLTAAGQRRIHTGLSPLRLMAAPHQNRLSHHSNTVAAKLKRVSVSCILAHYWDAHAHKSTSYHEIHLKVQA